VLVVSEAALKDHPQLGPLLRDLAGTLDERTMQRLSVQVELQSRALTSRTTTSRLVPVSASKTLDKQLRHPELVEGSVQLQFRAG